MFTIKFGGFLILVDGLEGFDKEQELPLEFSVDFGPDGVAQLRKVLVTESHIVDELFAKLFNT